MIRRVTAILLAALLCSVPVACRQDKPAESPSADTTQPATTKTGAIKDIAAKTAKINSFTLDYSVSQRGGDASTKQEGTIKYLAPDNVLLTGVAPMLEVPQQTISNGTTMWVVLPEQKMARSVDVAKVKAALKEAGLPQQNAWDVVKDPFMVVEPDTATFEGVASKGGVECYVFSGTPRQSGLPVPQLKAIRIFVGVADGAIRDVELFNDPAAKDEPDFTMSFKNVVVNPKLDAAMFTYTPPPGVVVSDQTDLTIKMLKQMLGKPASQGGN